jgi:ligand-binding SRPBCC domain-containing protein
MFIQRQQKDAQKALKNRKTRKYTNNKNMYTLTKVQRLPISLEEAWAFFSSPKNLATITPDNLGFQIRTQLPEEMYAGMFIQYTVRPLLGIPTTWVTEITHVEKPRFFVDEQRVGPYRIWHHQHHFKAIDGGVAMTDIIDYRLPLGLLGKLGHPLIVKPRLQQIFNYREQKLHELFGVFPD